jgi:hypothetical protein
MTDFLDRLLATAIGCPAVGCDEITEGMVRWPAWPRSASCSAPPRTRWRTPTGPLPGPSGRPKFGPRWGRWPECSQARCPFRSADSRGIAQIR